ncbi:MAG: hypothetical protein J3K34DRAFT_432976 [Monoraphidium minutum]|nr:MAG: hypothetical protein J3K34DRAFT_432976 [Monoraphidium minutum]
MLAATRSIRAAAKAPVSRASVPVPRRTVCRASEADLKNMAAAAKEKGAELVGKAQEALKGVDVDKVKEALSVDGVKGAINSVLSYYGNFDADGDGKLTIDEAVALLNSKEVADVSSKVTGQPHTMRTAEDIKKWFNRADFDKSKTLSKREFTVMYVGLMADKAKTGVKGMASAIIQALDSDNDGIIQSTELKAMLANTPLGMVVNVIPDGKEVNYRELLSKLPGH